MKAQIYQSGDIYLDPVTTMDRFKELIAKSFRGNKKAQKELRRLGQGELVDAIVQGRKRISKNSRRIIDLVKKIDPDYTVYSKEKIEMIEDTIERYMGRIFGAYVFPDWRPPNRPTATKREKDQHNAAVEQLAAIYAEKQGTGRKYGRSHSTSRKRPRYFIQWDRTTKSRAFCVYV